MKKIITKFFLISLFTCLSFFSIDKVYAVNIDTYDERPDSSYVYLSGNPWAANPYHTTLKGLNYWVIEDPNRVESMRFTYNIYPSNETLSLIVMYFTFKLTAPMLFYMIKLALSWYNKLKP